MVPMVAVLGAGRATRLRVRASEHDCVRSLAQAAAGLAALGLLAMDVHHRPAASQAESLTVGFHFSKAGCRARAGVGPHPRYLRRSHLQPTIGKENGMVRGFQSSKVACFSRQNEEWCRPIAASGI